MIKKTSKFKIAPNVDKNFEKLFCTNIFLMKMFFEYHYLRSYGEITIVNFYHVFPFLCKFLVLFPYALKKYWKYRHISFSFLVPTRCNFLLKNVEAYVVITEFLDTVSRFDGQPWNGREHHPCLNDVNAQFTVLNLTNLSIIKICII